MLPGIPFADCRVSQRALNERVLQLSIVRAGGLFFSDDMLQSLAVSQTRNSSQSSANTSLQRAATQQCGRSPGSLGEHVGPMRHTASMFGPRRGVTDGFAPYPVKIPEFEAILFLCLSLSFFVFLPSSHSACHSSFYSFLSFPSLKEPPRGDGITHTDDDVYAVYKVGPRKL